MKKINSTILILIMILGMILSINTVVYAEDEREIVSEVLGESVDIESIPDWGANCIMPTIDVTEEEQRAYFDTTNGNWQRKEGNEWQDYSSSECFRSGTWRYRCNIYIKNGGSYPDAGDTHKLAEQITVKVNNELWTADKSVINSNNSRAMVYSKEYEIEEPDVMVVFNSEIASIEKSRVGIPINTVSLSTYVEGGTKPYIFSKISGPDWINVSSDGIVSGTPTSVGDNARLKISVKDSSNPKTTEEIDIYVAKTEINLNDRITISKVTATSNIDSIPQYGESLTKPNITVTSGEPAYFLPDNGTWQRKNNNTGSWEDVIGTGNFEEGIWRFTCRIYIDNQGENPTAGDTHKLASQIEVKVNDTDWNANPTDYVEEIHRSVAKVFSPEYYLTEPGYYVVSFESNGGSFVKSQTVQKGKKADEPTKPTKEGYAFVGWYKEKTLNNKFDFDADTISAHTVLYAKWLKYYTISAKTSWDGTNAERGEVEGAGTYKDGDSVTLKAKPADGFYFEAWKEGESVVSTNPTYSFTAKKDRTLKAIVQEIIPYEVKFETFGGTSIPNQTVWTNNPYATKPENPTKQGYGFDGWYADEQFKNPFDFSKNKIEHDETRIYAKWHKHTGTNISAKPASCKATGNTSYYKCTICNKTFKDANSTQEIAVASTIIPKLSHQAKEERISKEKTKATLKKDGKIVKKYQTKCTLCGEILGTRTSTEKIYYAKTIKLSKTTFTYNKKVQVPIVTIKDSKGKIIDAENYTITYSNKKSKKVGEYTVKITFKNKYKGKKELKYTIKPQGTTLKKLSSGEEQFKAKWSKNTDQTSGYQIQYATDSKFKKNSSKELIEDNKKTSQKFKKLKAKKKYYVRIRTYKIVKGKKYYSSWSQSLTVKTKKQS